MIKFREYEAAGGELSFPEWTRKEDEAIQLQCEAQALLQKESIARKQANRLSSSTAPVGRKVREGFVKLFNSSNIDLGITSTGQGRHATSDQSTLRTSMIKDYCPDSGLSSIWEPVLGMWLEPALAIAAHLYPWRSEELMDTIFGEGALKELFTPHNGLFLHKHIKKALESGFIAIVPDQDLEPLDATSPAADRAARHDRLKKWEATSPKEYKVIVLDAAPATMRSPVFSVKKHRHPVNTLAELHGRKLVFLTDFRPRSRYVWWTYLNAITQISYRQKASMDTAVQREVEKGVRYWGTDGRYVKRNQLLGFIEEIGHDFSSIAESILENSMEEDGDSGEEADFAGVAVLADETIARVQEQKNDDSDDSDSSDDDMDDAETTATAAKWGESRE